MASGCDSCTYRCTASDPSKMMTVICSSMRVQVVMVRLMVVTHAADVSSTIFQNVYCSCGSDLASSS